MERAVQALTIGDALQGRFPVARIGEMPKPLAWEIAGEKLWGRLL